jgi:outer membrane protein assembly complex protein YaeT
MSARISFALFILFSQTVLADTFYTFQSENKDLEENLNLTFSKNRMNKESLNEKVGYFLRTHGYHLADLSIEKKVVKVANPIKWELFFTGNDFYTKHFLQQAIEASPLSASSETFASEVSQIVIDLYKKEGFHFVQVEGELVLQTSDSLKRRLLFNVVENKIVRVKRYDLQGNFDDFSKQDLLKKLMTYSKAPLNQGIYHKKALDAALTSLKNDLNNLGYFDAVIDLENVRFNKSGDSTTVKLKIFTNTPNKIRSVEFVGNEKVSDFWLKEILGLKPGDQMNLNALEAGLNLIEDYYLQRGFLKIQIEKAQVLSYSEDLRSTKIKVKIFENPQIVVSEIRFKSTEIKTKKSIILRELAFREGEVLTIDKLKGSLANLNRLGYLSNVNINVMFEEQTNLGTPVELSITERKSGSVTTGIAISTELDFTVKTFLGFDYKNIRGTGRSFSAQTELKKPIEIDYLENRIFLTYLEPYLFETSAKGRVNLSRNDEIWDRDTSTGEVTVIQSNRLDLIFEKTLNKHTSLYFTMFSLDLRREKEIENRFDQIQEVIGSVSPTIEIDYRNHPYLPTKGFLTRIDFEYASPFLGSNTKSGSGEFDLEFAKIQGAHSFYKPLSKRFILAQSFRGGYLYNFVKDGNAIPTADNPNPTPFPKSRAFFLGGATTIRGFDPSRSNERIPSDLELAGNTTGRTLGGGVLNIPGSSYFYLSKTELRFPLAENSNWWGAIFYDGGSVQILPFDLDRWRHSVGFGVRFNTPLGSILNAEIAYKLDRNSAAGESAVRFHLSVSSF